MRNQKAFAAWQAEQAHCSAKEKQSVPVGERPAIPTQLFSSWVRPSGRTLLLLIRRKRLFFVCPAVVRRLFFAVAQLSIGPGDGAECH